MKSFILLVIVSLQPVIVSAQPAMSATYAGECRLNGQSRDVEFVIKQEIGADAIATINKVKVKNLVIDKNLVNFDANGLWRHGTVQVVRHYEGTFYNQRTGLHGWYTQQQGGTKEAECDWSLQQ